MQNQKEHFVNVFNLIPKCNLGCYDWQHTHQINSEDFPIKSCKHCHSVMKIESLCRHVQPPFEMFTLHYICECGYADLLEIA